MYYLWEISKAHRVSLIVNEDCQSDPAFQDVIKLCTVEEVIYLPNRSNIFARHRFYSKTLRELVLKHPSVVVLQYNDVYVDNYYLAHFAKKQNTINKIVIFQVAQMFPDYVADYSARISCAVNRLKLSLHIPSSFAKLINYLKGEVKHLLEFKLLPLITLGEVFAPKMKLVTGKLILKNIWKDVDFKLYYINREMEMAAKLEGEDPASAAKRFVIRHPLETIGMECNVELYSEHEENLIIILPTYGLANALISQTGADESDIINKISEKWCEVIEIFQRSFKGWKIAWKLHPNAERDSVLGAITSHIQQCFPDILVMKPSENASSLILRTKIILSDVSTVLWWASFIKGKIPISLDIFNYPGGNGMKEYEGIYYFETISQLQAFIEELMPQLDSRLQHSQFPVRPSLTDFLSLLQRQTS